MSNLAWIVTASASLWYVLIFAGMMLSELVFR